MEFLYLNELIGIKNAVNSLSSISIIKSLSELIVALSAIFAVLKIFKEIRYQKLIFIEGQNLKEREFIRNRLDNFFAPLKELRSESRDLYSHFALSKKKEARDNNEKIFRTLRFLTEGKIFSDEDQAVLEEIIDIGKKQLHLIETKGCVLENTNLAELLGRLGAHIRLLNLAADHRLDGMSEVLEDLVFPLEVDGAIESEIRKLNDQYNHLLKSPFNEKEVVKLSKKQKKTIAYYDNRSPEYFRETAYINMSYEYSEFRKYIPFAGNILDAGCGVGRDTRYFIKKGYKVISFDASIEMVKLCRQYPFSYCEHKTFGMINFIEEFDGVWACASLIHLSCSEFKEAIFRLANSLKPGGVLYFSLKIGEGLGNDEGRFVFYHDDYFIENLMIDDLGFEFIDIWTNVGRKNEDNITNWMNYIYKKPQVVL